MDDKIRDLLKDLGNAINESISASTEVNAQIQKLRDEGYDLYVVLDATIGLNKSGDEEDAPVTQLPAMEPAPMVLRNNEVQFRIDVKDLSLLRSLGIDPTRKVRTQKRLESKSRSSDES
ncbi:MAG TPA: hypothetical protein VNM92_12480 [Thermoanaerobaculia bacterium]|nr:hypothetical protein [Thermoanaerobaculia bacterium]